MAPKFREILRDLAIPTALFATIAGGGFWLGMELDLRAEEVFRLGIHQAGEGTAQRIEQSTETQLSTISLVSTQVLPLNFNEVDSVYGDSGAVVSFHRIGAAVISFQPGFQAVNWIGLDGRIEMVWPQRGNEKAKGQNLLEHPEGAVRQALRQALSSTSIVDAELIRSPLITLYQGGLGFSVYQPTFHDDGRLIGVLNAAFRVRDLVAAVAPRSDSEGRTEFGVFGPAQEELYLSAGFDPERVGGYGSVHQVKVLDEPWELVVQPSSAWLEQGLVKRGGMVVGLSLGLGLGIAVLTWGFMLRRRRQLESDLRLQLALDGASLGVWDLDVATGALHLNDQWVALLGYSADQVGLDLAFYRSLVHPEDLIIVETAMRDHLEGRTDVYRTEHRLRASNGDWIWVLDMGRIVERDSNGAPRRVAGTQTDFTDMRRAELELERSVGRYRAIFEHSPVGLLEQDMSAAKRRMDALRAQGIDDLAAYFAADPDAIAAFEGLPVTLDINPAFLRLFEATTVAEYRENVLRMVDDRARRAYEQELLALFSGATTCEVDFPLRSLAGEQLLYTVRLTVAPGCQDDLSSVFVSLVDNTRILREEEERRQREDRTREMQKEESLALLAGGVAHDFNNLLVPIIGNIELAMQDLPRPSSLGDNLQRAERAAQRAAELARQMLTYSGRGQVKNQAFDLNALVIEMSALLASSLPGKVELISDFHDGVLGVEGDPTQLRQLVMNLVINGADAIGAEEGRLVVRTGYGRPTKAELSSGFLGEELQGRDCIFFEVRDSGHGIDEETRKRIFEPFFSTKSAGRGLGMSVVLGIVRGHGGSLVVSSQIGKGTRIRAYFPETQLPVVPQRASDPGVRSTGILEPSQLQARVLLADDEAPVRHFAVRALEAIGATVVAVCDGVEAVEAFRTTEEPFDLAILDATMPRMGGIEAMEGIRSISEDFPVILSSGYTLEGVATRAAESKSCWFLPKPFGVSELTRMVGDVLAELGRGDSPTASRDAVE